MAVWSDLLTACRDLVAGFHLVGLPEGNVRVRKLPGPDDALDALPLVTVCPAAAGESETPLGFQTRDVVYPVQFTVIRPGDGDLETHLDQVLAWREQIRSLFYLPAAVRARVPSVWQTQLVPAPPLDRRLVNRLYDYTVLVVHFHSQEAA